MPTYQYRCAACDNRFDAFQKFADDPLTECPVCGGAIRRVIQPVGVVFKGSGWYINDSRKKPSEPGDSSSKSSESSSSESSDSGSKATEAKPGDSAATKVSSASKDSTVAKPAAKKESKAASAAD